MKNKKVLIVIIVVALFLVLSGGIYFYLNKEDKDSTLTLLEKQWIENNKNKVVDFAITSNIPIFNYDGSGIFLDFLDSLETNVGLEFNKVSYAYNNEEDVEYGFFIVDTLEDNYINVYEDNYVLVSKNLKAYNDIDDIKNISIGVIEDDLKTINDYLLDSDNLTYKPYKNISELISDLKNDTVDAIALPKTIYLEEIISDEQLHIVHNITDYKKYFVIKLGNEKRLNDVITKYYNKWKQENFNNLYNQNLSSSYFKFSNIGTKEEANFRSKQYIYGFITNSPYDKIVDGKLKGINNALLKSFSETANIEIKFKEFSSIDELLNNFNANKIDLFFGTNSNTEYDMDVLETSPFTREELAIVSSISNDVSINSIKSLSNRHIKTVKGTKIEKYLIDNNIEVEAYDNITKLLNNLNKNDLIAIDLYSYNFYNHNILQNYKIDYTKELDSYSFNTRDINDNDVFNKYFSFYISFISNNSLTNSSYYELVSLDKKPIKLINLFVYLMAIIGIVLSLCTIFKKLASLKKQHKTFSKEDKLKYIDMTTSLKNRNYLNDNIEVWDNSGIYPQAIIITDLNNIAYINDNYGHQEGDNVIKEAANILIKNQIENSEIIRTNGNEFLIYLVGYEEKQISAYTKKITKELKNLAHGFGTASGYSMINDAIKTIDDAINEATIEMRNNKDNNK